MSTSLKLVLLIIGIFSQKTTSEANIITHASPLLYKSTAKRAYFKQVKIVVPSSWSPSPEYKLVPKGDYMSTAEVRIAPPHSNYGDIPYTLQLGDCGERGQYIHMTPEFLLETFPNTNRLLVQRNAKIFLHEWAHLRYGVFNEYGERGNPNSPIFYKDENDKIRINGCSEKIRGWIRRSDGKSACIVDINNNLVKDCTFYPDLDSSVTNGSGKASLMYMPELNSTSQFCGDNTTNTQHNPSAPNLHNRKCNTLPVMDVVLNNEDFKNNRNPPRDISNFTTEFQVVQLKSKSAPKFVLVLDVSASMRIENRFIFVQEATSRLLKFHIKDECNINLGMVSFSSRSTVHANLTKVNNSNRDQLIQKIPQSTAGATGIGSGILKGIEVLRQSGGSIEKSKLILLSDGEENVSPRIGHITKQIKQAGVVIYTLAIGNQASQHLEELSRMTGGKSEFFNAKNPTKSMDSILNTFMLGNGCNDTLSVVHSNKVRVIEKRNNIQGTFHVDNCSFATLVFISYDTPSDKKERHLSATITCPRGNTFNHQSPECTTDENLGSILFRFTNAQHGKWDYRIENPSSEAIFANIMINSDNKRCIKSQPVLVKTWISSVNVTYPETTKIFAVVTKDGKPVVRAKVEAIGYRPDGTQRKLELKDDGKGADQIANDGTYTQHFIQFSADGRYQVDVIVTNTKETRLSTNRQQGSRNQRAPVMPILLSEIENEKPKAEFSLHDLPHVNVVFESSAIYTADTEVDPDFDSMDHVDDFERFDSAGTFLLNNWSAKDLIPPSKITDLSIVATNVSERIIHLEWTSTGDDMFDGTAKSIDLRYHYEPAFLIRSFDETFSDFVIVNGSLDPLPAYEKHAIVIQLPLEETFSILNVSRHIYFAARALDEEGNVGQVSNAAIATFPLQDELQLQPDK